MNIAIDAAFGKKTLAGLEVWARDLLDAISVVDRVNRYLVYGFFWRDFARRRALVTVPDRPNFSPNVRKAPRETVKFLEDHGIPVLERWFLRQDVDVFHAVNYFLPRLRRVRSVLTVHDVSYLINQTWHDWREYRNMPRYLRDATRITVVSGFTADDLRKYYAVPREKIDVIYSGINRNCRVMTESERTQFAEKCGIRHPYLLTVATADRRKNLEGILAAFKSVCMDFPGLLLVVVGNESVVKPLLIPRIRENGLDQKVVFPGYIDTDDLVGFYNNAEALVFPSFYEGFGFPVLEAMACGCPVITSNLSALPEIAGDAALLVDPYRPSEIAENIKRLLNDSGCARELRLKGLERVKLFSWDRAAGETVRVYEEVYRRG